MDAEEPDKLKTGNTPKKEANGVFENGNGFIYDASYLAGSDRPSNGFHHTPDLEAGNSPLNF